MLLSKVITHLKELAVQREVEIEFVGLAGKHSEKEGVRLIGRSEEVAVVGLTEVFKNLRHIFEVLKKLGDELPRSDRVICVDMPDFNFRLARMARKRGMSVDYLVCPQVWAWREDRVFELKKLFRRVYPVLPFEEDYLNQRGVSAKFLGHPIRDVLPPRARKKAREDLGLLDDIFAMAVLPGSRKGEIARHLPILVDAWEIFIRESKRRHQGALFKALLPFKAGTTRADLEPLLNTKQKKLFNQWINSKEWVICEDSWQVMQAADFGWVASGTATLEAAYYQLPHILFYRLSWLSARIIRSLTSYFSAEEGRAGLPNILLERNVIPEILQNNLSPERLAFESLEILANPIQMNRIRKHLRFIPKRLGKAQVAERMAEDLWEQWGLAQNS